MADIRIELLYSKTCHVWKDAMESISSAVSEMGLKVPITVLRVDTDEEAEKVKFPGSPTVKINGRDIDPMFSKIRVFRAHTCRMYLYNGKYYEYPPKEMIMESLKDV